MMRFRAVVTVCSALMAGCVGGAVSLAAFGAQQAAKPAVVATVNLGALLEKLNKRADLEASLRSMDAKMKDEAKRRTDELKAMQADFEKLEDTAGKEVLREKFMRASIQYQAWELVARERLDTEASLLWQDLYRTIKSAAAQLANQARYDLIFVDDSQGELSSKSDTGVPREAQIMQQIAGRRMLFAGAALDISDDLIVRMNNAHAATGP